MRFLRLPKEAWGYLTKSGGPQGSYVRSYVVGATEFTHTWRASLIVVDERVAGAAVVRRRGQPGYRQDRLEFAAAAPFTDGFEWSRLVAAVSARTRKSLARVDGDPLPAKTREEVEAALSNLEPGAALVLARIRGSIPEKTLFGNHASLLREQRDAVALGLQIAGLDSREVLESAIGETDDLIGGDVPFLRGWNQSRFSEAAMIRHDSQIFDRWLRQKCVHFDTADFQDPDDPAREVTVYYADREALERQTGTDLIYYRRHRPGFILVQYKRMRTSGNRRSTPTYYPDGQLDKEIARYRGIPRANTATTVEEWRLTDDAYFIKLVRDDLSKPSENRLVQGRYLPLGLVDLLMKESKAGTRGKGWSEETLTTYLSNAEFLQLAKQGYIGTRGAATEHLQNLILDSLGEQRGVVLTEDKTDHRTARHIPHG